MKGKGGLENVVCEYCGVWQRIWGKWVVEICEFKKKVCFWFGSFFIVKEVVLVYDIVVCKFYGFLVEFNLFVYEFEGFDFVFMF